MGDREFLRPAELAARYKGAVNEGTLARWRSQGQGPIYMKIGGKVVYALNDVLAWEDTRRTAAGPRREE